MKKTLIRILIIAVAAVLLIIAGFFAYIMLHPGNSSKYSFDQIEALPDSPLIGKRILVLGSSVTHGMAAKENAVAEYLGRRFSCDYTKEAVIGTTLGDHGNKFYVKRLKALDTSVSYDLFICQLSTNDATKGIRLGEISKDGEFDVTTTTGAIEYIIRYVQDTWHCPVVFYTNSRYESPDYDALVDRLYELQEKYGIGIIDLWSSDEFNDISPEMRKLYLFDKIHPFMAGYRDWWGPEMEKQLLDILSEEER